MEGSYTLQDESGQQFEAPIAPFHAGRPQHYQLRFHGELFRR
jgi:uncharacterized protein affecting Mg2+/Co2+ transport